VAAGPGNVLSGIATIRATGADSVFLRYWRDGEMPVASPAIPFGMDSTARPSLLGLRPDSRYRVEVDLVADHAWPVDTLELTTGTLPDWIPAVGATGVTGDPGFVIVSIPEGPVIVDDAGRPVWYRADPDPTLVNFQAHPTSEYTIFGTQDETRAYRVLDELGRETGTLSCVGYVTRFHEVRILPDSTALLLCDDTRTADLSAWGGSSTADVTWTVVQRVGRHGEILFEWNTADHFELTDGGTAPLEGSSAVNLTHGNAVDVDADGNLLVSFRNLNEITKIDVSTHEVIWRFGGQRGTLALAGDPKGSFERQHGLRVVGPGVIQFLDNSDIAPSRLVRYRIDEAAGTATLVWAFVDGPLTHTLVGGSTQVLPDGGALVSFGRAGRIVEVDASGRRRWELTGIDGAYAFRTQRIPSLYAARRTQRP
jgi:hypothetical protein